MKKNAVLIALFSLLMILPFLGAAQQRNEWVNQVIIGNGGKFESTPPYQDYVTLQSYDPDTQISTVFATLHSQSIQDILIKGTYAYVAVQDSIFKYDIDTYTQIAAVADSGVSRLALYNNRLIVTKQYPIQRFFVEILNAENLALLGRVQNISGDCGDAYTFKDTAYVAVNGGYLGMEGKLAVINTNNWTLVREVNFGSVAVGSTDLCEYNGLLYVVNVTPYGGGNVGSITAYNLFHQTYTNYSLPCKVGKTIGLVNNMLYLILNYGVGSFNLLTKQIADTSIIQDPGSSNHIYITSGATDYINNRMYLNIGDQAAFGLDVVATLAGDSLTSFQTGISADAIAVDYRTPVGIDQEGSIPANLSIFPNPVSSTLKIKVSSGEITGTTISDLTGRILLRSGSATSGTTGIDCSSLPAGLYILNVTTQDQTLSKKFIKN